MKFNFYYHRTANLFHFISNLSEWDLGCSPRLNDAWLKKTGDLTRKEKDLLRKVADIIPAYERMPETKSYLEFLFLTPEEKTIWDKVKSLVSGTDLEILEQAFEVFEPRFDSIWTEEKKNLSKWCNELGKFSKTLKLRRLERNLYTFFRRAEPVPKIDVCLLLSTEGVMAGNNLGYLTVALKCAAVPLERHGDVMGVLYHEASHAFWERPHLHKLVSEFVSKLNEPFPKVDFANEKDALWTALVEAVVSNLFPEGYLACEYLDSPRPQKPEVDANPNFANWRLYCAAQMFNTTERYIENRKPLDMNYIDEVWRTLKDFTKEYSAQQKEKRI